MRVLITGAGGQLGNDLAAAFADDDVVALARADLDVTDEAAVVAAVTAHEPDTVVNAAAFTAVDRCEDEPEPAWQANAAGAWWLARACRLVDAQLVHVSTDYVFDGTARRPYTPFDPTSPTSVYGRTKAAGEQLVRQTLDRHYVVRTSWVQGAHGGNFVKTMLRLGRERDALQVVDDQVGSPTFTADLAPAIRELAATGRHGTYHVTNAGTCTWHDLAAAVFARAGLDVQLGRTDTASFGAKAPRPAYSVLDATTSRMAGLTPLPSWEASLDRLLHDLGEH